jgi:chlorobactene glucosyltransferase
LFTDADTIHRPLSLKSAITYSLERNLDLLSLYPQSRNLSFWEKVTQPLGGAILNIWYPFEQVNNPAYQTAFANGQYILIKKSCYLELGGHEGVKGELLEDVALAEKAKGKNKNIRMAYGFNLFSTRMYKNFPEIWKGWRRIFSVLLGKRKSYYPISLILLFLLSLLPFILVFKVSFLSQGSLWAIIYWTNVLEMASICLGVGFMYRLSKNNPVWALFHPVGCLIMAGIILDALVREIFGRPISWRGTIYPC